MLKHSVGFFGGGIREKAVIFKSVLVSQYLGGFEPELIDSIWALSLMRSHFCFQNGNFRVHIMY